MAAILSLLLLAAGAVAYASMTGGEGSGSSARTTTAAPAGPDAGTALGVLTEITQDHLTVRPRGGGAPVVFGLRPIDRGRIDLFHLGEHMRLKWPVRIFWEREDGKRYAARVEDA